jgi:UDPglucose--hexose-1-phosphate uridylyltransferase
VLKTLLLKTEVALDRTAYNYIIHTSPFDTQLLPHYHWHMEVIPRLTRVAGFEWGTGFYINPVPPEQAAQFLHETEVDVSKGRRS